MPYRPVHLLLADDEKDFIETLCQRLNARGYGAEVVFNGKDALKRIENDETIDVVIMDITMPGMNGIETLLKIKKRRPLSEFIMLTGHATIQSAIEAIKFGAFDYLMKPCEIDQLVEKINSAAARKRDRENQITQIRMEPYITAHEKEERITKILSS
jgi:DNA-binding NtrC family response regulator